MPFPPRPPDVQFKHNVNKWKIYLRLLKFYKSICFFCPWYRNGFRVRNTLQKVLLKIPLFNLLHFTFKGSFLAFGQSVNCYGIYLHSSICNCKQNHLLEPKAFNLMYFGCMQLPLNVNFFKLGNWDRHHHWFRFWSELFHLWKTYIDH